MKKTILALALVATTFGAFAQQTPAPAAKKVAPKTEKHARKAKKDTVTTTTKVVKPAAAKPVAKPAGKKG